MKKIFYPIVIMLSLVMFISQVDLTSASSTGDCNAFQTSYIPDLSSTVIPFTCAADAIVYFGACDSGDVPNDDLFNITFKGQVVSFNQYNDGNEFVSIGSTPVSAGSHRAILNSLSTTNFPPATFSYAVSSDAAAVEGYLINYCGEDIVPGQPTSNCASGPRNVPVFTQDAAPSSGTLEFRILLGNEDSREASGLMMEWDIAEGQQLNNAIVPNLISPRYARVWWQPTGDSNWYLLTSQYWQGDGTTASEYGIECTLSPQPSYHTSFASAIPTAEVCFDLLNGCK